MKRIFHIATKSGGMVAWNINGKVVLIAKSHFREIIESLLQDKNDGDQNLNMFCLGITLNMKSGNERQFNELQELLNTRLFKNVEQGKVDFRYNYLENEAQDNIEDFLEAYKYNTGHIFYAIGVLEDGEDIINISLRKKPSIFQKIQGKLGDSYSEINILRKNVSELDGTSFEFRVKLFSGKELLFSENALSY